MGATRDHPALQRLLDAFRAEQEARRRAKADTSAARAAVAEQVTLLQELLRDGVGYFAVGRVLAADAGLEPTLEVSKRFAAKLKKRVSRLKRR